MDRFIAVARIRELFSEKWVKIFSSGNVIESLTTLDVRSIQYSIGK